MNVKLKYKQNKAFFKNFNKKFTKESEALVENAITNIETEASARVPVDTGVLKSSITSEYKGLNGRVFTNINYAPYIEFGTGGLVDVPVGLEDYALKFKGDGLKQVNIPPRAYMMPAFFKESKKLIETLDNLADGIK